MNCPNCGFDLPDDAMFCGNCGSKIELAGSENVVDGGQYVQQPNENVNIDQNQGNYNQGEPMQQEVPVTPVMPGTPDPMQQQASYTNNPEAGQQMNAAPEEPKGKSKLPMILIGVGAALVIILGVILAMTLLDGASSSAGSDIDAEKAPAFYEEGGDLYILYPGDTEGTELVEDFEDTESLVALDEDTFYYISDEEFYYKDGNKDAEEIYDDAIAFILSESGKKAVLVNDDFELFFYNGKDVVEVIDERVSTEPVFSDDEKKIAFTYNEEDEYVDIPCIFDGEEYEEFDFDDDDYEFSEFVAFSSKYVYYTAYDNESYDEILFRVELGEDSEEITDEDIYDFEYFGNDTLAYIADGDLYYYDGEESEKIEKNVDYMYGISEEDETLLMLFDDDGGRFLWSVGMDEAVEIDDSDEAYDFSYTEGAETIVFCTEDEIIVTGFDGKKVSDPKAYDIEDITDIYLRDEGSYAFLIDDDNTMYIYKVGDDEAEEILDDVSSYDYRFSDSKNALIVNEDMEVYYYDGKEAEQIGEDFMYDLRLFDDGSKYAFIDDKNDFYYGENGEEAEEIEGDIYDIHIMGSKYMYLINEDAEALLYKAGDDEAEDTDIEVDDWYSIYYFLN